jgi:hypothetical protein
MEPHGALHATERRVLGVLIEKGLSTPEYYPMTLHHLVAGCNQKNNRDPVTQHDEELVTTTLRELEGKGLVASVIADTGRVNRWRQELVRKWELSVVELAVLGELLLRGAQSEGELRARASRMRPVETLEQLLERLRTRVPPLVVRLTPPGTIRGVRWTHALYPTEQLQRIVAEEATHAADDADADAAPRSTEDRSELATRIDALEARLRRIEKELGLEGGLP